MAKAIIDGISTRYDVIGSGPAILMFSPGGFDATLEKWRSLGVYERIKLLDYLPEKYSCIVFDRRETGESGGRIERVSWDSYVAQGKGLLDHLGIKQAHIMGGCMGCCPVAKFAVSHPETTLSMIHYWPVGGAKYRINGHARFAQHLAYVHEFGLEAVVTLANSHTKNFSQDPRVGPWASVLRNDSAFAEVYAQYDVEHYKLIVAGISRSLLDRDTAPGAEPEDLLRLNIPTLIIPGQDGAHATSAARYLQECIPGSEYWDVAPAEQTEANAPGLLLDFLDRVTLGK